MKYSFIVLLSALLWQSCSKKELPIFEESFNVHKGTNISHWLSQSHKRGSKRDSIFTEKDVVFLKELGFDHLRLPVDEEQLWDEALNKDSVAFALLHREIKNCQKHGLRVIIDFHILRSHYFNAKDNTLWTDSTAQNNFEKCWMDLSEEFKVYPNSFLAYEIMNEPVAKDPEDWNKLIKKIHKALRRVEPNRVLVIGSNDFQSYDTFDKLRIPENDTNILLSFHFYHPMPITHYATNWTTIGEYKGPITYPGICIDSNNISDTISEELRAQIALDNKYYDKDVLQKMISKPLKIAREKGLKLYCGEWGCVDNTPHDPRMNWYKDMIDILTENKIAWANWDYKAEFGLVDYKTGAPNKELIDILTK